MTTLNKKQNSIVDSDVSSGGEDGGDSGNWQAKGVESMYTVRCELEEFLFNDKIKITVPMKEVILRFFVRA